MIKHVLNPPPIHPAAPSYPLDQNGKSLYSDPEFFKTNGCIGIDGQSPMSVCQTIHLVQLAKTIQTLSELSSHAGKVFHDLAKASALSLGRIDTLRSRVNNLKHILPIAEDRLKDVAQTRNLGSERLEWRASFNVDQQLFVKDTQNFSVQELYDACFTIPKFSSLDVFREDNQTCAKFFSYPQFFLEQWKALMEREHQERKKKKKSKKRISADKKQKEFVKVSEIKVKKYNRLGELIVDDIDDNKPKDEVKKGPNLPLSLSTNPATPQLPKDPISILPNENTVFVDQLSNSKTERDMHGTENTPATLISKNDETKQSESSVPENATLDNLHRETKLSAAVTPSVVQSPATGLVALGIAIPKPPPLSQNISVPAPPPIPPMPDNSVASRLIPPPPPSMPNIQRSVASSKTDNNSKKDARFEMLESIRDGGFKLRKAHIQQKASNETQQRKGANDVATILMRRAALEVSDGESSSEGSEEEWD